VTVEAEGVQSEALWTLTVEAAHWILADALQATWTLLRQTLIHIWEETDRKTTTGGHTPDWHTAFYLITMQEVMQN